MVFIVSIDDNWQKTIHKELRQVSKIRVKLHVRHHSALKERCGLTVRGQTAVGLHDLLCALHVTDLL